MDFQIGNIGFKNALFMAPMEGITDVPFRRIVREHGCGVTCTQMVHAEGLIRGDQHRMAEVTALDPVEKPVGFQICGSEEDSVAEAGKMVEDMGFSFIDINMGCPAKNVVKRGAGSALLQEPLKAARIIKKLAESISIPVTIKIRAGWDHDYMGGLELGKIAEEQGAQLISVHARTRSQKFKGRADWELIRELKSLTNLPVVGNGDIFAPEDIDNMETETQADGFMVARGGLGNPWIFSKTSPNIQEIRETLFRHLDYHLAFYENSKRGMITFRKHIVWYTKGVPGAAEFRVKVFKETDFDRVVRMLKDFFDLQDPEFLPKSNGQESEIDT